MGRATGGKGKSKAKFKPNKGTTRKGYTTEEAALPESGTQDNQWQETADTSQHETWQAMVPTGTGSQLDGKSRKLIIKTGAINKTGNPSPVGLPYLFSSTTLKLTLRAAQAACRAARVAKCRIISNSLLKMSRNIPC